MFGHDKDDKKDDEQVVQPAASKPPSSALLGIDDDDDDRAAVSTPISQTGPAPAAPSLPATDDTAPADSGLLNIKREALEELSPLVQHLDQSAEEKFETLMMMIQAADNQTLVPQAFAAAKQISDDKKRARALLDVVNEINYFTKKSA